MPTPNQRKSLRHKRNRKSVVSFNAVPIHRVKLVFVILCLGLLGLIGRMFWLQVFQSHELVSRARAFQTYRTQPLGTRRTIVDRKGRLVALDEKKFRLWAHPKYFSFPGDGSKNRRTPFEVAQKLSGLLDISTEQLLKKLVVGDSGIKVFEGIDPEIANTIETLGISGLDLEAYPQRVYPQGELFANVVGFLNQDRIPQAGLEQSKNKQLLRNEKERSLRRGADGTPLPDDLAPGSFFGDDLRLQLTLDARLQELAVKSLSAKVREWKAKKAAAIVMDARNGELLVLASTPSYDPNKYWNYSPSLFREWSVQDLFEPGSTFKPINLALALQEGVISPDGTVDDTGSLWIGGWPIHNHNRAVNGSIDYGKVLQVSSNVGMVKTMRKLNPSVYWDWLHRLGLDVQPETDLPGAVAGQLKNKDLFVNQPIEPATASFGQGFSLTPLKLVQLHALIANGGYMVKPHITRGLEAGDGFLSTPLKKNQNLLNPYVTKTVQTWMESVVQQGSGRGVHTPGYRIAGKTGTAQKAINGSYKSEAKTCSFVANLPAENPRFVVLVVVDEPQGGNAYGSTVALPVAKEIIDGLLVLEKIPPAMNSGWGQSAKS